MSPLSIHRQLQLLSEKKRPAARLVVSLLLLSCFLVCLLTGWEIWTSRQERLAAAEVSSSNMARALALHAGTTMKVADLVLEDIVERAEKDGLAGPAQLRLREHLEHLSDKASELYGLFVYDARGRWMATSLRRLVDANNADREYFRFHQANPGRATHIGAPIRSRSSGVWIIPVSRRIDAADGSFAGVALVTLRLDFFESAYSKLDVGQAGTILFALDSGLLYYRRPFVEKIIGLNIASGPLHEFYRANGPVGTAMLTSRVDGVKRLYSYRHLDGFPLIVAAALSAEEIYTGWWDRTLHLVAGLAFFIGLLLWLGKKLLGQLAIRERLEQQLHIVSDGLVEANSELSALALKDGLTQLANRRAFDNALRLEFARAQRESAPIALLMLDIDHFKGYNDRYGHPAGDACLRQVAAAIAGQASRPTDLAARYGGEEFAVLLPCTELEGAAAVGERIRAAVAALGLVHESTPGKTVTVSIGVAATRPASATGGTPAELLQHADIALYRSKSCGRNQVTAYRRDSEGDVAPGAGLTSPTAA